MTLPTMESLFKRLTKIRQKQLSFLTAEQAREYGFDLDPGWAVEIDFGEDSEEPKYTYISPDKWKFSDMVYGDEGELLDYLALSPEGKKYTKAELGILSKPPEPIEGVQAPLISEETTTLLRGIYPEMFEPGAGYGIKPEDLPQVVEQTILTQWEEDPDAFLADLRSRGDTPDTRALLKLYGGSKVTDELLDSFFEGVFAIPEISPELLQFGQKLTKALPLIVKPNTVEWAVKYFSLNPDILRSNLITAGRNSDTEVLVKFLYPQITERGLKDYFSKRVPGMALLGQLPTHDWMDKVKELVKDPVKLVPFVSSGVEIVTLSKLMNTALDLEKGKEVSLEDLLALKAYVDRATMDTTWGYEVADVIAQLIPFAGEFIATYGIFAIGKTVVIKAGQAALKRIATKTGLRILEGKLAKYGVGIAGVIAGGTLQTIPMGITRIPASTLTKQLQATLAGDEEAVWKSALKALGEQWVETVSESTGGLFAPLTAPIKGQLIKVGLFKAFLKANPNKSAFDINRILGRMGYHGVIGEMSEERVADVGHGILEPLGLSDQKFSIPSLRQLSVELVSFSIPGVAAKAIQTMPGVFDKLTPAVKTAISEAAREALARPERGAIGKIPEEGRLTKEIWDKTPLAQRVINAKAVGLEGKVGSKAFEDLTSDELNKLSAITQKVTVESVTAKITRGEQLTLDEEQFRVNNRQQIEDLLKWTKKFTPEGIPKAPEVPKPTRPLTEAEKPAMVEYYRKEAQNWRDIANKETLKEPSKEGEARFAIAIQKAEAFEKAASELAIPKAPVTPEVIYTVIERGGQGVAVKWSIPGGTVELIRSGENKGKYLAKIGDLEFTGKTKETAVSGAKEWLVKHPEVAIPKAEVGMPEVTYIREAEARAKEEGISIAEASRKIAEEKITAEEVEKPYIMPRKRLTSLNKVAKEKAEFIDKQDLADVKAAYSEGDIARLEDIGIEISELREWTADAVTELEAEANRRFMAARPVKPEVPAPTVEAAPPSPDRPVTPADTLPPAPTPPSIEPTPSGENVIGLRTIQPGLIRSETIGNIFKRAISKLGVQVVEADPLANAAMNERARVHEAIESNAHIIGTKAEAILLRVFTFDKQGRIPLLAGIDATIDGAPTIQDVAARLPTYRPHLSEAQFSALKEIKEMVEPYRHLLEEVGVEVSERQDVMAGGFYLPRGRAALEGIDEPVRIGAGRRGMRKGFERPALFDSQAEGINKGYKYASIGDVLTAYAFDAGVRATDAHVANYFKALTDDVGNLLGETVKMRLIRQNPEIAKAIEEINKNLTTLRRNIGALTQRQMDVIDLWQNDPEFNDIDILMDGLATMRAGTPAQTMPELKALYEQNQEALRDLRPHYKKALRRAQATPRDQGVIILPALAGRTFPVELSNAANQYLMKEGRTIGALAPVINVVNAINNLYRGVTATLDNSAMGIQGLLGMYGQQKAYIEAVKVNIQAWGIGGDKILGKFLVSFDAQAIKNGRLTSSDWARVGGHLGGATHEFQLGGARTRIGNLPGVRQANRAFGYLGDALRLEWWDSELSKQMSKRSLNQIRESGDLERIANAGNVMTGWHTKKFAGSLGDLVLYAPRFFQSRLSTVAKAGMGLRPNATLDQRMARMALLKMIGFGTVLTILGNMLAGEDDTDFRPVVDGKRNPKFMRIKFKGHYYSLFGTWDSLLAMFINIGTGRPLQAIRGMSSGIVKFSWDIITGRDYNYKAVTDTPMHFVQWLGDSLVPFAIGDVPRGIKQFAGGVVTGDVSEAAGGITQIIAELLGYKVFPEKDWKENRLKLGLPIFDDPALYSIENPIYTFDKYASDVLSKLGSIKASEVIGDKDYPLDVQAIVQSREYTRELGNYPNRKLTSVNADSTKGDDTYIEFYKQWQKQQELVAAGDKAKYTDKAGVKHTGEDAVKAFKNDYKQSEQGNMTQSQYALLTQYHQIIDPKRKAEFLKANPELSINPYQVWLKSHPKENAYLALTDGVKILTKEAYNQFLGLLKSLDIPNSAIPPMTLPPATSIDAYFERIDIVDKWGANSWEDKLLRAKNPELNTWLGLGEIDTPIASLGLKVKYREQFDLIKNYGDKDSPDYIADEKARAEAVAQLRRTEVDGVELRDIERRVDAIEKGTAKTPTPEPVILNHIDYMRIIDEPERGSSSAEAMLFRVDNPDYNAWRMDKDIQGDNALKVVDESKIPIWRIDVRYRKEDAEYDALPTTGTARADYLAKNEDYRKDRRRRNAYGLTNPLTGETFPTTEVENYVAYYEIPVKGFRQERFIVENPAFAEAMYRITGKDIWLTKPEDVPNVAYDDLYDQYQDLFDEYASANAKRKQVLFDQNPAFKEAYYRRKAYGELWDEHYVDSYATYMLLPDKGYAKERFLKAHMDFYLYAKEKLGWTEDIDFTKIPTEAVEKLWNEYQDMQRRKVGQAALDQFREDHLDFDAWGVLVFGWVSIKDKKRRAGMTPKEKFEEAMAELSIELEKQLEELRKRLEALQK